MTFYQARAISKTGLHVRRSSWAADKWFIVWRGTWFCFLGGNPPRPVAASDYTTSDLLADDWTTMPNALSACAINTTTGSTGGGAPTPGAGGFPPDPSPQSSGSVVGGGGGGGSGIISPPTALPPFADGKTATLTFSGIITPDIPGTITGCNLNKQFTFPARGGFGITFPSGVDSFSAPFFWNLSVATSGLLWSVIMTSSGPSGGFDSHGFLASPITNFYQSGMGDYAYGGIATIAFS